MREHVHGQCSLGFHRPALSVLRLPQFLISFSLHLQTVGLGPVRLGCWGGGRRAANGQSLLFLTFIITSGGGDEGPGSSGVCRCD